LIGYGKGICDRSDGRSRIATPITSIEPSCESRSSQQLDARAKDIDYENFKQPYGMRQEEKGMTRTLRFGAFSRSVAETDSPPLTL